MGDDDYSFDDVETMLDSDLEQFGDKEIQTLYDQMERYTQVADIMAGMERYDDASYFQELAVDTYKSFCYAMQLQNDPDEWSADES